MLFGRGIKNFDIGFPRRSNIQITVINEECGGVPIIIAPGFLTENSDEWLDFISKHIDTQIIYVKWRSSSVLGMTKETLLSILTSLATTAVAAVTALPLISVYRVGGIAKTLSTIYGAWSRAASEANFAGEDLANFLNDVWDEDDKGVFIGHSLGVRVITAAMTRLKSDNILSSISIAGAINVDEYEKRITKIKCQEQVKHTNIFSNNDAVLKYLYRPAELSVSPLGLKKSNLSCVNNIITDIGHTEHHSKEEFSEMIINLYNEALNN